VGAFDFGGDYRKGQSGLLDTRLASAIRAFKRELIYNGSRRKLRPWLPVYGDAMTQAVMDLQRARELPVTGRIDSDTAMEILRKRIETEERQRGWPHGILGKKLRLEAGGDPVAIGQDDPRDHGGAQINLASFKDKQGRPGYHDVRLRDARNPAFFVRWAADYIASQQRGIEKRLGKDAHKYDTLRAARAAYNVGQYYATEWLKEGFPSSGRLVNDIDWFARATRYLKHIDLANF